MDVWAVYTRCSLFSNDGTRGYCFHIEWMCGQCAQGVPRLVMTAQGVTIFIFAQGVPRLVSTAQGATIFVLNGCVGSMYVQGVFRLVMMAQGVTVFVLNGYMGSLHKVFLI